MAVQNDDFGAALSRLSRGATEALFSNLANEEAGSWSEQDLAEMFNLQLEAPLDFDLSSSEAAAADRATYQTTICEARTDQVKTFRELFAARKPPSKVLEYAKAFFKERAMSLGKTTPAGKVAYVFLLLNICKARAHDYRVSNMTDPELLTGIEWALEQTWVEESARTLLIGARSSLGADSGQ